MDTTELVIRLALIVAPLVAAGVTAFFCVVFGFVYSPGSGPEPQRGAPEYWRAMLLPPLTGAATVGLLFAAFYVLLKTLNGASLW